MSKIKQFKLENIRPDLCTNQWTKTNMLYSNNKKQPLNYWLLTWDTPLLRNELILSSPRIMMFVADVSGTKKLLKKMSLRLKVCWSYRNMWSCMKDIDYPIFSVQLDFTTFRYFTLQLKNNTVVVCPTVSTWH